MCTGRIELVRSINDVIKISTRELSKAFYYYIFPELDIIDGLKMLVSQGLKFIAICVQNLDILAFLMSRTAFLVFFDNIFLWLDNLAKF